MIGTLIGPELRELIAARNFTALREVIAGFSPADLAECITDLPDEDQAVLFRLLPHALAADVLEYLAHDEQQRVLRALGREDVARILDDMSPDDRTALLEDLPAAAVTELLTLLSPAERAIATNLLGYPEDSVGRLMTPDFLAIRPAWTVQETLDHIRQNGRDSETLNVLYVTDPAGRLIDDVRIRELLLAPLTSPIDDLHDSQFIALRARDDRETALALFKKYDRTTLPVVDAGERLLGIVTIDDMLDVQEEETTEDIHRLGAVGPLEEPYMETPLLRLVRQRATWLVVLFIGQMLTATVMGAFSQEIEKAVILALFVPLIISSGGNSGSQAATLIIRAMALGEITLADWWRVAKRELLSGLLLGGLLGAIGFARILIAAQTSDRYGPHPVLLAWTVTAAVAGVVLWGTLSGAMLPLILRRCGLDPATSSAPFVATLVDVTGLIIYFGAALLILKGTVL